MVDILPDTGHFPVPLAEPRLLEYQRNLVGEDLKMLEIIDAESLWMRVAQVESAQCFVALLHTEGKNHNSTRIGDVF